MRQTSFHVIECQVYVLVILSLYHVLQTNDVLMAAQTLQIHYLTKRPLRICRVPKSIEAFLQSDHRSRPFLDCFPDDTVSLRSQSKNTNCNQMRIIPLCLIAERSQIFARRGVQCPLSCQRFTCSMKVLLDGDERGRAGWLDVPCGVK